MNKTKLIDWAEIHEPEPTKAQLRKLRAIGIRAKPATREIACCLIEKYEEILEQVSGDR